MGSFNKIPSLIQIWFAEFLGVMFLFPVASKIYERFHPAVQYHSLPLDKADYVFFVIGLLVYAWLLATIGRLGPMPDRPPSWKNIGGLEELPRRPRWLFEEERP